MTKGQIAELQALNAAAIQPPWTAVSGYVYPGTPDDTWEQSIWIFGTEDCGHPPTAALIVAMRNALPHLLSEREAAIDRLHAVAWKVVIAAGDDKGKLLPPGMLGEYWRRQIVRDLADVLTLLGGDHGDCGDCQEAQGAGQAQEGAPAQSKE